MKLDPADLRELQPLIDAAVRSTIAQIDATSAKLADRIGFPEAEAATLLGVPRHVLRDARLRGEIVARTIGRKIIYGRAALMAYVGGAR